VEGGARYKGQGKREGEDGDLREGKASGREEKGTRLRKGLAWLPAGRLGEYGSVWSLIKISVKPLTHLHRLRDIDALSWKIACFPTPPLFDATARADPIRISG